MNVDTIARAIGAKALKMIEDIIAGGGTLSFEIVSSLPATGITGVFYLIPAKNAEGKDIYEEYVWISSTSSFERLGTTDINLSGYSTTEEIEDMLEELSKEITEALDTKQDSLTEGKYIEITDDNVINVTLTKADLGLENVDNTSDADKPISEATQEALDDLEEAIKDLKEEIEEGIKTDLDEKQDQLTEGNNIEITDDNIINVINVVTSVNGKTGDVVLKISDLENDKEFIDNTTDNLLNYYDKDTVNDMISEISTLNIIVVSELPTEDISTTTIYLLSTETTEEDNIYKEYIYVNEKWELIGDTKLDLSNYVTFDDLEKALEDYATIEDLDTTLEDYITSEELEETLEDYITSEELEELNFIDNTVDDLVNYYLKTETYTQEEVKELISQIVTLDIKLVDELPTEDISTTTIYLVLKEETEDGNIYNEYIYVNENWELLGDTKVDISGLVKQEDFDEFKELVDEKLEALKEELIEKLETLEEETNKSLEDLNTKIDDLKDEFDNLDEYELPAATDTTLGGIIVSSDFVIDEDGLLELADKTPGMEDAPADGNLYGRKDEAWEEIVFENKYGYKINITEQIDGVKTDFDISTVDLDETISVFYAGMLQVEDLNYTIDAENKKLKMNFTPDREYGRTLILIVGGIAASPVLDTTTTTFNLTDQLDGEKDTFNLPSEVGEETSIVVFYAGLMLNQTTNYTLDYDNGTITLDFVPDKEEKRELIIIASGLVGTDPDPQIFNNPFVFDGNTNQFDLIEDTIDETSRVTVNGLTLTYGVDNDYYINSSRKIIFNVMWGANDSCRIETL